MKVAASLRGMCDFRRNATSSRSSAAISPNETAYIGIDRIAHELMSVGLA